MTVRFNLLEEPWIPCLRVDGQPIELGVRETLAHAHELREVVGDSPLVTGALLRLLLAVLHRVFGPEGYEAWGALWHAGLWDPARLDDYLGQWRERFELFHPERPFYQAPASRAKPKSAASMMHEVASGNNATLFDHHTEAAGVILRAPVAARMLVTSQAFGLAMLGPGENFVDGPCARGVIFFVSGRTLFETLMLNLIRCADDDPLPEQAGDRPSWEMDDPFLPARTIPLGYLDYLTWYNRRIMLIPEDLPAGPAVRKITMGPGLRLDQGVLDPMKSYRQDVSRGWRPLRFSEHRALWRDSVALLRLGVPDNRPPRAFDWLAELVAEELVDQEHTVLTLAVGMANDQAKVDFIRSERLPVPLAYLRNRMLVDRLGDALQMAEAVSRQLWGAARRMATLLLSVDAGDEGARQPLREDLDRTMAPWGVERSFWSRLEVPFRGMVEALPSGPEEALERWHRGLVREAWRAFDHAAELIAASPRSLKATVRARDQLAAGLAKALPAQAEVVV
jgi:CRISPR system Cascade subunit CasA